MCYNLPNLPLVDRRVPLQNHSVTLDRFRKLHLMRDEERIGRGLPSVTKLVAKHKILFEGYSQEQCLPVFCRDAIIV